jgi:hypothetical protein
VALAFLERVDYLTKVRREQQALNISMPANSKARYSHNVVTENLLRDWNDGLYLRDKAAFQVFLGEVYARGNRGMLLESCTAIREYHRNTC